MEPTKKYTVITGASSGIGRETAKAFANRGKNLIVAARRTENLEALKREILEQHPTLDVVIRTVDLSVLENVYQFYSSLKDFQLETWVNNAGFGNYDSVADFNTALAPTPDELTEFLAAIADVSGTISPDDENYDFFATTMTFSAHELYCEHMGEEFTLFVPMSKQSRPCSYLDEYGETVYDFNCFVEANVAYSITNPTLVTVAERDKALLTFREEMQFFTVPFKSSSGA